MYNRKQGIQKRLNPKMQRFCELYVAYANGAKAAREAGYSERSARAQASALLTREDVQAEILRLQREDSMRNVATAQDVMEYLTKVMRGELKDQFGLEASLGERTKAATELARRTIDIENRAAGNADAVVQIKLDWSRD